MVLAGLEREINVFSIGKGRIDNFEALESWSHRLLKAILRVILGVDETIPAVEALDI